MRILLAVLIVTLFPLSVVAQNCPLPDKAIIGDGRQCICDKGILLCLDYEPKDDKADGLKAESKSQECYKGTTTYPCEWDSKSQEWWEKCDSKIKSLEDAEKFGVTISLEYEIRVNSYCTRALLEEIRK